jgi:tetratricopeptide (TPR) repeat protein
MNRPLVLLAIVGLSLLLVTSDSYSRGPSGRGGGGPSLGGAGRSGGGGGPSLGGAGRIGGGGGPSFGAGRIGGGPSLGAAGRSGGDGPSSIGRIGDGVGNRALGSGVGRGAGIGEGLRNDGRLGEGLNRSFNRDLTPGSRPAIGNLPGTGRFEGLQPGNRPAINLPNSKFNPQGLKHWSPGDRAGSLPGLADQHDRQQWLNDHHQQLSHRLHDQRANPDRWQHARQDLLHARHDDWKSWMDHRYPYHHPWHNGYWHGYWDGYWSNLWHRYPVAAGFAVTAWSLNALGYWWGLYPYVNPYYVAGPVVVYDYSQPICVPTSEVAPPATDGGSAEQPGFSEFDQGRDAFYQGNYAAAQRLAEEALKKLPNDAVVHEFRALCQFAQRDYRGAAATLNAVLAVGPGWNWATLISLYPGVDTYTAQLRALEGYLDEHPEAGDARFVLAYHYLATGAKDSAITQLREVVRLVPKDQVAKQLLEMLSPTSAPPSPTPNPPPAGAAPTIKAADLVGTWKATGVDGARFELTLNATGEFVWKYAHNGKDQVAQGAYAIEGDTLAMEPQTGGVMLAQITLQGANKFVFKPIGSDASQPVNFSR